MVAIRRHSRALTAARGPPDVARGQQAWCSSSTIRPDSFDAFPSTPEPDHRARVEQRADRRDPRPRAGRSTSGSAPRRCRWRRTGATAVVRQVHAVRQPHVRAQPAQVLGVLGRGAAVRLQAELPPRRWSRPGACAAARRLARASAAQSRISSPVTENGEQGATAIRVIESGDGSCQRSIASCDAARIASWSSTTRVRRQPALRLAQVHRPAGRVEPQPDPPGRLDLRLQQVARRRAGNT